MLLALWFDFWDTAAWTGVTPPPPPVPNPGAGGGHKKRHHHYERADSDYWDAREALIARHSNRPALPAELPDRFPEAEPLVAKRQELVALLPRMPDLQALADLDEMINDLDLQLEKYRVKCDEEALLALLL